MSTERLGREAAHVWEMVPVQVTPDVDMVPAGHAETDRWPPDATRRAETLQSQSP